MKKYLRKNQWDKMKTEMEKERTRGPAGTGNPMLLPNSAFEKNKKIHETPPPLRMGDFIDKEPHTSLISEQHPRLHSPLENSVSFA